MARKNKIAKGLATPRYRQRVIPNKKKSSEEDYVDKLLVEREVDKKYIYTVRMTHYYKFKSVEANSEEEAKQEIENYSWDEHLMDVIFDIEYEGKY